MVFGRSDVDGLINLRPHPEVAAFLSVDLFSRQFLVRQLTQQTQEHPSMIVIRDSWLATLFRPSSAFNPVRMR